MVGESRKVRVMCQKYFPGQQRCFPGHPFWPNVAFSPPSLILTSILMSVAVRQTISNLVSGKIRWDHIYPSQPLNFSGLGDRPCSKCQSARVSCGKRRLEHGNEGYTWNPQVKWERFVMSRDRMESSQKMAEISSHSAFRPKSVWVCPMQRKLQISNWGFQWMFRSYGFSRKYSESTTILTDFGWSYPLKNQSGLPSILSQSGGIWEGSWVFYRSAGIGHDHHAYNRWWPESGGWEGHHRTNFLQALRHRVRRANIFTA
jgi:hypothetical protein